MLAMFTVFYNIVEGLVSVYFGVKDETLSLLGFGVDSFVEVIFGIGIWHMLSRIKALVSERDEFEKSPMAMVAWTKIVRNRLLFPTNKKNGERTDSLSGCFSMRRY